MSDLFIIIFAIVTETTIMLCVPIDFWYGLYKANLYPMTLWEEFLDSKTQQKLEQERYEHFKNTSTRTILAINCIMLLIALSLRYLF